MNDPLYSMQPSEPDWLPTLAQEAEDLHVAIVQSDHERVGRKLAELHHAIHEMTERQT